MKKLILSLIIYMICLNGMEKEVGHYGGLENLPTDVTGLIITILNTHDTLDGTISAIKTTSKKLSLISKKLKNIINEKYGAQKNFTALIHILADKFKSTGLTTEEIAQKFNSPAAKKYIELGDYLILKLESPRSNQGTIKLIEKENIDVNFSQRIQDPYRILSDLTLKNKIKTPLTSAIQSVNEEMVKILLSKGAKPRPIDLKYIEFIKEHGENTWNSGYRKSEEITTRTNAIEAMITQAMQNTD